MQQSYDEEFCAGTVEREVPALAELARNVEPNSTAAIQFCITFLGVCDYPKVQEWAVPFPSKPYCDAPAPAPSNKKPLKVVHYSDIHVDPLYVTGSSTECKKAICCRYVLSTFLPKICRENFNINQLGHLPKMMSRAIQSPLLDPTATTIAASLSRSS